MASDPADDPARFPLARAGLIPLRLLAEFQIERMDRSKRPGGAGGGAGDILAVGRKQFRDHHHGPGAHRQIGWNEQLQVALRSSGSQCDIADGPQRTIEIIDFAVLIVLLDGFLRHRLRAADPQSNGLIGRCRQLRCQRKTTAQVGRFGKRVPGHLHR